MACASLNAEQHQPLLKQPEVRLVRVGTDFVGGAVRRQSTFPSSLGIFQLWMAGSISKSMRRCHTAAMDAMELLQLSPEPQLYNNSPETLRLTALLAGLLIMLLMP